MHYRYKKRIGYFFLIILLSFNFNIVYAQHGENGYLYQHIDEITNHDNFGYNQSIAHNPTIDVLELENSSSSVPDYEDFTLYTETDNGNDLTVNSSHIQWSTMIRNVNNYVTYDFGAAFFHDFNYTFVIQINDIEAGDATGADIGGFMCFSTINGAVVQQGADDTIHIRARQEGANDDLFRWYLLQRHNGATKISIIQALGTNNPMGTYYCRLYRSGTNITFWAFTDEAMTIQNARLSTNAADDDDSYRYHIPLASINSASDPNDHSSGYFFNDWLGNYTTIFEYADNGYIFRNNVLNAIGFTLVDLLNVTIPTGDNMTLQYSNDNATWGNLVILEDGFNSIELRDLNYTNSYVMLNMTDNDADSTPRLHQFRSIYWNMTAPSGGVVAAANPNLGWIVTFFIGIPAILILVVKRRKR